MAQQTDVPALDLGGDRVVVLDAVPEQGAVHHVPMAVDCQPVLDRVLDGFGRGGAAGGEGLDAGDFAEEEDFDGGRVAEFALEGVGGAGPAEGCEFLVAFDDELVVPAFWWGDRCRDGVVVFVFAGR